MNNPYLPLPVVIKDARFENDVKDLKTFDLEFVDAKDAESFAFVCGQFAMVSINGVGEAPFGIASSPMDKNLVQFTIKRYAKGLLTTALHNLAIGQKIGMRGPFGNGFPMDELRARDILLVGGGFALTTLRATVKYMLHEDNRDNFGKITMFAAARDPGEMLYKDDLEEWAGRDDIEVVRVIDQAAAGWEHKVGYAAPVLAELAPEAKNTSALVCGPPIMIKTCVKVLGDLGFEPEKIISSLEMKMKCGIGKCGRCNIGSKYICKDGPVFTYKQMQELADY